VAEPLAFLSDEWVAELVAAAEALPERPGATATVSNVVVGGPEGKKAERAWRFSLVDGRLASAEPGAAPEGEADLVLTQSWDDAATALRGGPGPDVGFMRGSTKVVGSVGTFMALLPVLRSDEWRAVTSRVAERTAL
jgi:hypothetical protein